MAWVVLGYVSYLLSSSKILLRGREIPCEARRCLRMAGDAPAQQVVLLLLCRWGLRRGI